MTNVLPFPSRGQPGAREFDLSDLVHEVCRELESQQTTRCVGIELDVPPFTMIHADRGLLRCSIGQLLTTSMAVSPTGSDVVLTGIRVEEGVELEIASGGAMFIDGAQEDAVDSRWAAGGWRAAWLEVRRIMARNGVEISIDKCPDGGLAFTLFFPHWRQKGGGTRQAA
jgi:hypothetical protein